MTDTRCPFCPPDPHRVFHRGDLVIGLWDAFPVSPGHALLIPTRHVASWFDATPEEQTALVRAVDVARREIEARHRPDGYNIALNVGEAAGQTVFHLHVHVIPRYRGDVADPRGGVRHLIPGKGFYQAGPRADAGLHAEGGGPADGPRTAARRGSASHGSADRPQPDRRVIVTGGDDPFRDHLVEQLGRAIRADVAVAFVTQSGLDAVFPHLEELLERGGQLRFLTGDCLDFTEPEALEESHIPKRTDSASWFRFVKAMSSYQRIGP